MCLTMPGKVVAINGGFATVDYGEQGSRENVNVSLVDVKPGSFVLVQGGFAIKVLTEKEARESLEAWKIIRQELDSGEIM